MAASISFAVFQSLSVRASKYGEAEHKVLENLELDRLLNADFWQSMIINPDISELYNTSAAIKFATDNLPHIVSLLDREYPSFEDVTSGLVPLEYKDKGFIKLILAEEDNQFSSADRLVLALKSVQGLYDVVNFLNKSTETKLLVLGIDSGSDKTFDLLGISQAIADTKELILGLFDRLVFRKHESVARSIENIAQSLPVFEKLGDYERDGTMPPEQCELLRRKLVASLGGFVDSGAMIPEMDSSVTVEPRIVMRPQPKLLSAPVDIGSRSEEQQDRVPGQQPDSPDSRHLSPDEANTLRMLLKKVKANPEDAPAGNDISTEEADES